MDLPEATGLMTYRPPGAPETTRWPEVYPEGFAVPGPDDKVWWSGAASLSCYRRRPSGSWRLTFTAARDAGPTASVFFTDGRVIWSVDDRRAKIMFESKAKKANRKANVEVGVFLYAWAGRVEWTTNGMLRLETTAGEGLRLEIRRHEGWSVISTHDLCEKIVLSRGDDFAPRSAGRVRGHQASVVELTHSLAVPSALEG